jgi:hypothetical protein
MIPRESSTEFQIISISMLPATALPATRMNDINHGPESGQIKKSKLMFTCIRNRRKLKSPVSWPQGEPASKTTGVSLMPSYVFIRRISLRKTSGTIRKLPNCNKNSNSHASCWSRLKNGKRWRLEKSHTSQLANAGCRLMPPKNTQPTRTQ